MNRLALRLLFGDHANTRDPARSVHVGPQIDGGIADQPDPPL